MDWKSAATPVVRKFCPERLAAQELSVMGVDRIWTVPHKGTFFHPAMGTVVRTNLTHPRHEPVKGEELAILDRLFDEIGFTPKYRDAGASIVTVIDGKPRAFFSIVEEYLRWDSSIGESRDEAADFQEKLGKRFRIAVFEIEPELFKAQGRVLAGIVRTVAPAAAYSKA